MVTPSLGCFRMTSVSSKHSAGILDRTDTEWCYRGFGPDVGGLAVLGAVVAIGASSSVGF